MMVWRSRLSIAGLIWLVASSAQSQPDTPVLTPHPLTKPPLASGAWEPTPWTPVSPPPQVTDRIQLAPDMWEPIQWAQHPSKDAIVELYRRIGAWSAPFRCKVSTIGALVSCASLIEDPPGLPADAIRENHERTEAIAALLRLFRAPSVASNGASTSGRTVEVQVFVSADGVAPPPAQPSAFGHIYKMDRKDFEKQEVTPSPPPPAQDPKAPPHGA